MKEYSSTLSVKRILISLLLLISIPVIESLVFSLCSDSTIARMFALNICGSILIMYDWNLFAIHYNRAKYHRSDSVLYTIVGMLPILAWTLINSYFLHGYVVLPDSKELVSTGFAGPCIVIAHTFILASIANIGFKVLTDHFKVHSREITLILLSGFLFGLLYTLLFLGLAPYSIWIPTYLYNVVLISILAYLYNQCSSFIPGILAMSISYFMLLVFIL